MDTLDLVPNKEDNIRSAPWLDPRGIKEQSSDTPKPKPAPQQSLDDFLTTPVKSVRIKRDRPICLTMIVKDEEHIIERCLRSAAPFIDTYCICDTGSTDRTKAVIKEVMSSMGIDGIIKDHKWNDFGHNRTMSLICSRMHCPDGWSWVIDADDKIGGTPQTASFWNSLPPSLTSINVQIRHGNIRHRRTQIFSNTDEWYYKGRLHELPQLDTPQQAFEMPDIIWHDVAQEGNRSKDPYRWIKDADALKLDLAEDPTNARTVYYIAQSYRCAGAFNEAKKYYKQRVTMEGFFAEKYMSYIELMSHATSMEKKCYWAWKAMEVDSSRLDAPHHILHHAVASKNTKAFTSEMVGMGLAVRNPTRSLYSSHTFAQQEVYDWKFSDVFSIALFYKGFYKESAEETVRALAKCPESERGRIQQNLVFSTNAMK